MPSTKTSRGERTRDALLTAGFDLMIDRPVDAIPIDDLIASAGVGKGTFFNHFGDKEGFKQAIAIQVRGEVEAQVAAANAGETDPLRRLVGGMREVADYALIRRKRTIAMLRMTVGATVDENPLNDGVRADIEACVAANLFTPEANTGGVLYWLGLCLAMITTIVDNDFSRQEAARTLQPLVFMGLKGLGADAESAQVISSDCATELLQGKFDDATD